MPTFSYNVNRSSRGANYQNNSWGTSIRSTAQLGGTPLYTGVFSQDNKNVRYFSGIDAEIYFEDKYIDEVVEIQFSVQQNVMPLVGYNSYVYDELALGSRMVQGSFAINFTRAEYLMEVLAALKATTTISSGGKTQTVVSAQQNTMDEYEEKNTQTVNNSSSDAITQWRTNPLWNHQFNLIMSYGDYASSGPGSTLIVLNGVQLTSCSQQLSHSGDTVLEFYTFIAKDIQFVPKGATSTGSTVAVNTTNSTAAKTDTTVTNLQYSEVQEDSSQIAPEYKDAFNLQVTGYMSFDISVPDGYTLKKLSFIPNIKTESPKYNKVAINVPAEAISKTSQKIAVSSDLRYDIVSSAVKTFPVNFVATLADKSGATAQKTFAATAKVVQPIYKTQ